MTWHSPDDGRSFVLNNHLSAGVANSLRSEYAVRAHAGHHDSENVCAAGRRHRAKQHIDRRAARVLFGALIQVQTPTRARAYHLHMEISRRDPSLPGG